MVVNIGIVIELSLLNQFTLDLPAPLKVKIL